MQQPNHELSIRAAEIRAAAWMITHMGLQPLLMVPAPHEPRYRTDPEPRRRVSRLCFGSSGFLAQGAVELGDEGAALVAEGFNMLQGPSVAPMTAAQCKYADLELVVSFWLVRPRCAQIASCDHLDHEASWSWFSP